MNRKLTYLLLALAVALWGVIVYRIAAGPGDGDITGPVLTPVSREVRTVPAGGIADSLLVPQRDPFGVEKEPVWDGMEESSDPGTPVVLAPPAIPRPQLQYTGMMVNPEEGVQVFLLRIDGGLHLMSVGETAGGVTLLEGDPETVTVVFAGQQSAISREPSAIGKKATP